MSKFTKLVYLLIWMNLFMALISVICDMLTMLADILYPNLSFWLKYHDGALFNS